MVLQKQQNSLIAGLRATNNAAALPQEKGKEVEEKGKEISVDREEEIETKARFIFSVYFFLLTTTCCYYYFIYYYKTFFM